MKIIKTFAYFIFCLILVSCGSDDNSIETNQNIEDIIGVWNLSEYSRNRIIAEVGDVIIEEGVNIDYVIEFKNNPKVIFVSGNIEYLVEDTIAGDTNTYTGNINGDLGEGFHTGEWKIQGDNLITKSGTLDLVTEIVEITSKTLILRIDNAQYSTQGNTVSGNTTLKYTR